MVSEIQGKVKLPLYLISEVLCYEDIGVRGGIAPPFLILTLDGGKQPASCYCFTPQGKISQYPSDISLCGPWSWFGCCGKEKNLVLPRIEPGLSSP